MSVNGRGEASEGVRGNAEVWLSGLCCRGDDGLSSQGCGGESFTSAQYLFATPHFVSSPTAAGLSCCSRLPCLNFRLKKYLACTDLVDFGLSTTVTTAAAGTVVSWSLAATVTGFTVGGCCSCW